MPRPDVTTAPTSNRWTALAVLTFARTAMGFQFQSVGAVSPLLVERLHISNADLGWLIGLFSLPGIVVALPGGLLGDRFGDRRVVLMGLSLMTVGSAVMGVAEGYSAVVVGRVISAAGAIVLDVLLTRMLAEWCTGGEIVWAMAIMMNAWPVGIGIALFTLPSIAAEWGLAGAFHVAAGAAAVGALGIVCLYNSPPRTSRPPTALGLAALSRREIWLVATVAHTPRGRPSRGTADRNARLGSDGRAEAREPWRRHGALLHRVLHRDDALAAGGGAAPGRPRRVRRGLLRGGGHQCHAALLSDLSHDPGRRRGPGPARLIRGCRLVRSGPDLLVEILELVRGKAGRLADGDDLLLVGLDLGDGRGNFRRDLRRDGHHPVLVEVHEVARLDPNAAHLDGDAEIDHVHVGVGNGDVGRRELELERAHLVQIAHGAVGDHAHAPEGAVNVGLHLAPLGALAARLVEVVHHDHARRGDAHDVVPPAVGARAVPVDGALLGADEARRRIAHEGAQLGKEPADLRGDVALLAGTDLEDLDGIGHARAGDLLERLDLLGGQRHGVPPCTVRWCPCASR